MEKGNIIFFNEGKLIYPTGCIFVKLEIMKSFLGNNNVTSDVCLVEKLLQNKRDSSQRKWSLLTTAQACKIFATLFDLPGQGNKEIKNIYKMGGFINHMRKISPPHGYKSVGEYALSVEGQKSRRSFDIGNDIETMRKTAEDLGFYGKRPGEVRNIKKENRPISGTVFVDKVYTFLHDNYVKEYDKVLLSIFGKKEEEYKKLCVTLQTDKDRKKYVETHGLSSVGKTDLFGKKKGGRIVGDKSGSTYRVGGQYIYKQYNKYLSLQTNEKGESLSDNEKRERRKYVFGFTYADTSEVVGFTTVEQWKHFFKREFPGGISVKNLVKKGTKTSSGIKGSHLYTLLLSFVSGIESEKRKRTLLVQSIVGFGIKKIEERRKAKEKVQTEKLKARRKAKEKAKAEKTKAREKARLEKLKAREKARLEKLKAREKVRLEKTKERRKARLEKLKARRKAKEIEARERTEKDIEKRYTTLLLKAKEYNIDVAGLDVLSIDNVSKLSLLIKQYEDDREMKKALEMKKKKIEEEKIIKEILPYFPHILLSLYNKEEVPVLGIHGYVKKQYGNNFDDDINGIVDGKNGIAEISYKKFINNFFDIIFKDTKTLKTLGLNIEQYVLLRGGLLDEKRIYVWINIISYYPHNFIDKIVNDILYKSSKSNTDERVTDESSKKEYNQKFLEQFSKITPELYNMFRKDGFNLGKAIRYLVNLQDKNPGSFQKVYELFW